MDEKQRLQEYIKLIEELLNCSDGEETEILSANRELVDAGLLQVMAQVAEELEADGNQNAADFIRDLNSQLVEVLGISETSTSANLSSQDYQQFLMEVLQATEESGGNSEVIYPILRANLDKLDNHLISILQNWSEAAISEAEPSTAEGIAGIIFSFANLILQFPLGRKATNVEISIVGYKISLTVFTYDSCPNNWAAIQSNLGNAYCDRVSGERAENLEVAITAYKMALQVLTLEANPIQWATTQNNLGTAYSDRISGEQAENLEMAIAAYKMALQVYTPEALPGGWAMTQNNLGAAYKNRIFGDRAENLETAIAAYKMVLQACTCEKNPIQWAITQNNLGNVYCDRIFGDRAENLETAIAAYKMALQVRTHEAFPIDWAMTQNNLGVAYLDRILGDRAENLEMSIAAFHKALEVRTLEELPLDWADTQNNLGAAYNDRILGDRAENLEMAVTAYQKALQVYTADVFPVPWADIQNNLGAAYVNRILGDRAENLEMAIVAFQKALKVRTPEAFPINWATTENNLGAAYVNRILGDRAENLEMAIAAFQKALQVRTLEANPIRWTDTQNNLGAAYVNRILGDRAENLEMAIAAFQQVLQVRTLEANPIDWPDTQNNLGAAYVNRILGDRAENLEMAIAAFQQVLQVCTLEANPIQWARTQSNLGAAYHNRISGEQAENLEMSIAAYKQALQVRTPEELPIQWAHTQNNLGIVYSNRILGERSENLKMAITTFQKALEVRTLEANPIDHLQTARNLGNLHFTQGNWQSATTAYEKSVTAVELSRSWASNDTSRQKVLAEAIDVYQKLVQAYINIEQWDKAIETVERSKTRNLVELLANRDLYPKGDVPQEIISQLDQLRRSIPSLERQLQVVIEQLSTTTSEQEQAQRYSLEESKKRLQQELQTSRFKLDEVLDLIKPIDSSFSLTQRVEQIAFSEIQSLLDDRTAAIEWYVTEDKILTFILTANSLHPLVEEASLETLETFGNWSNDYFQAYLQKEKKQWKANLDSNLEKLAEILNIDHILTKINEIFNQQGKKCDRLILIPHRFLHLFPLHAMPLANGDLLMERFPQGLSYAPSIQLLQLSKTWSRPSLKHFFSVKNPTEDLSFADIEVNAIRRYFHPHDDVLEKQFASITALTQERLAQTNVAHFSCHGYFNFETPSQSALLLAGSKTTTTTITPADQTRFWASRDGGSINLEKCLTLGDIFALDLRQCRLATLSACETGLTDFNSLGDEYIGLPSGFLYAGSPSVVSSLWTVNDLSTAFLTIQFYQNLQDTEQYPSVAIALNQAQLWLRNLTKKELETWMVQSELNFDPAVKMSLNRRLHKMSDDAQPFKSPFYWAAFCAIGQ
ncbi:tetratricopeptide repeat protein [Sphaerospermopsis aphanizomenoides BCCUSP55]|uniref:CHAT domain-containing protein n=1 Tax=Sphaerospermopsis aphanizomenoides TaxID=459663 RepID=UPI001907FE9F|nr:CHAT domain-containing tetratricopeptide repeat protein [Sphaerospermopsis aphanizomenoides]MBK1989687.1 tetratricopeptide repeat protein [Sphaerospermopsis aphanizomenoides BCCUSP55]